MKLSTTEQSDKRSNVCKEIIGVYFWTVCMYVYYLTKGIEIKFGVIKLTLFQNLSCKSYLFLIFLIFIILHLTNHSNSKVGNFS